MFRLVILATLPAVLGAFVGAVVGAVVALPIELAAEGLHDRTVIATVEVAAKRYSVVPRGDQDPILYPELYTPRVSMCELDNYYR